MAKNYYIADLHLGHEKIIELCSRPFSSIEEMDEALIAAWNKKVHRDDRVYIVGDLIYKSAADPEKYLSRLKGKKYLILGNHDSDWLGKVDEKKWFEEVTPMLTVNTGHGNGMLCHYPVIDYRAKYLIHGHVHLRTNEDWWHVLKNDERALNAGVDVNGFEPVTLEELMENNASYKQRSEI